MTVIVKLKMQFLVHQIVHEYQFDVYIETY